MPILSINIEIDFVCDNCGTNIKSTKSQKDIHKPIDSNGIVRDLGFYSIYKTDMIFCSYDCKCEAEKKENNKEGELLEKGDTVD